MPRVKLIYVGEDRWVEPSAEWGQCEHPRDILRFDPRFGLPVSCYCMACGEAFIHPFHGLSPEDRARAEQRVRDAVAASKAERDSAP